MVKYSVIMPVYNKKDFVEKTVRSVMMQGSSDWEILAVDDESTDGSLDILRRLEVEDSRVKVFSIQNRGVSYARNFALQKACGEYVMFLDADDTMKDGLFDEFDRILSENDIDIIFTSLDKVDITGSVVDTVDSGFDVGICDLHSFFSKIPIIQAENGFFGFVTNKLIKRELIENSCIEFDTSLKLAEDLDFFLSVYEKVTSVYFSDKKSFNYLQSAPNSSVTKTVDYYSQIVVQCRFKKLLQGKGICLPKGCMTDRQITKFVCCYIIEQFPGSANVFCEKQKVLYKNKEAMESITFKGFPMFKKLMLLLAKGKMCRLQYFILNTKRKLRGGK